MPPLVKVQPLGEVLGIGRKESIFDTEGQVNGAALINEIFTFTTPGQFQTAGLVQTKKFGRDSNLRGVGNAGLPNGYKFGAYRWRCSPHTIEKNLNTAANAVSIEEINRYRRMSFAQLQDDQTPYMTAQLQDLVSWHDSASVSILGRTDAGATFLLTIVPMTDHEGRPLDVNKQPFVLNALQAWRISTQTPQGTAAANFSPTNDIYVTHTLDGVLVRPSN